MGYARKQLLFLIVSLADLALTCWLLRHSDGQIYEANPIARWWLVRFGAAGLACFKGAVVLLVLTLADFIARRRPRAAGRILVFGCVSTVLVVVYSAALCPAASRETIATREMAKNDQQLRNRFGAAVNASFRCPKRFLAPTLEEKEEMERLREALMHLRPEERAMFLLRQNCPLTYGEIAELRHNPIGTVKALMHCALQKLHEALQKK
jgi:DNA-directed RNA polymerase specialized sigma24 family protein